MGAYQSQLAAMAHGRRIWCPICQREAWAFHKHWGECKMAGIASVMPSIGYGSTAK